MPDDKSQPIQPTKKDVTVYEINSKDNICVSCECPPGTHVCFWACPIFDNELICAGCCQQDTLQPDIDKKFSQKLGKEITTQEINNACKSCGRNNAIQDPLLSPAVLNDQSKDAKYE